MIFGNDRTKFKGTIRFTVDSEHPDFKCIKKPDQEQSFCDTYTFDYFSWGDDVEGMEAYIKQDLALIAGGGYDTDHIHNVKYTIVRLG